MHRLKTKRTTVCPTKPIASRWQERPTRTPATAQFFINVSDNDFLDYPGQDGWGYCVFGTVTEGKEIVDKIKNVKTGRAGMHADVPMEDVVIEKAEEV